jgi:hypothetical protein
MYTFEKLKVVEDSNKHLTEKFKCHSYQTGRINFSEPWNSDFVELSEENWKELNKNGELTLTKITTETIKLTKT